MNFTGFQSVRKSGTSWQWQFTSAYTDWRRRTWRMTVWQSLPLLASDTYGPLAPAYCQYQKQGPRWGWGVLWSQVQSSGTVYQSPCEPQLSPHWRSLDIWRPTCSADRQCVWGPFMMRSTNLLIIITNTTNTTLIQWPSSRKERLGISGTSYYGLDVFVNPTNSV